MSSTVVLNDFDTYTAGTTGPAALVATGGAKKFPLPYPFESNGTLAGSATKVLAVKPRDMGKRNQAEPFTAGERWNQLVQAGIVTITFGAESTNRDIEEKYFDGV